ncbi:MAG TPA: hypothetical protein VN903_12630 [Polyangia bacterium]|jgi:hypothetical protein|nr:hypothetical protein [Polyangia bacterium]
MSSARARTLAGVVFFVGFACATTRAFDPHTESCTADADCEMTDFGGCCGCNDEPRAVNRAWLTEARQVCTVIDCVCEGKGCSSPCPRVTDPRVFTAVCRQGRCEAIKR